MNRGQNGWFRRRKRGACIAFVALMLCGFSTIFAAAEPEEVYAEQWQASGAEEWLETLPDGTKNLLEQLGVDGSSLSSITTLHPKTTAEFLLSVADGQKAVPLSVTGLLLGVLLLCSILNGLQKLPGEETLSATYKTVGVLAVCTALFLPLCDCIRRASEVMESTFVFMSSFVPVYAGVLVSSGNPTTALSFQSVVLFVSEVMTAVLSGAVTPLLTVSLGLAAAGGIDNTFPLCAISRFLNRLCTWTLGFFCTIFVGMLSLQTLVGTRADGVAIRAVRFSLANLVPVIGNAVSEAFGTVQNCLLVLRTTLGGIGVIVTGILVLPSLAECGWWAFLLSLCGAVADTLSFPTLSGLLKLSADVVKTLAGILVCGGLFLIISLTVVTMAARG